MCFVSSSFTPLVVIACIQILNPDGLNGGFGSSGIVDLDVEIQTLSKTFSISHHVKLLPEKSITIIWLSVHHVTSLYQYFSISSAKVFALIKV
jgi:hypothetical protein